MIVKCEKCEIAFQLDEGRIKPKGTKLRCSKCGHEFKVYPPLNAEEPQTIEMTPPHPLVRADVKPPSQKPKDKPVTAKKTDKPVLIKDTEPPIEIGVAQKTKKSRYVSFKTKLMKFAATLILFIAFIVIPIEAYRPWQELYQMIDCADTMVGSVQAAFSPSDLAKMNSFALTSAENKDDRPFSDQDDAAIYSAVAFNMILENDRLPSEKEVVKILEYKEKFKNEFDYSILEALYRYWEEKLEEEPGLKEILKEAKRTLVKAKENAKAADFRLNQIMIMLDSGKKTGLFKNSILYVLDSARWWKEAPSGIGELYTIENNEFWRELALNGESGYGHNPVVDPDNRYLPRFDVDEYGTWFSVWFTCATDKHFNTFNIDFNADRVKQALMLVFRTVAGVSIILVIVVTVIANWFSGMVTKPITELTKGAKEVARGNYDYMVPVLQEDELGQFTIQFNEMTRGQKERLNLLETLEKFLSKELAEIAAKDGLTLGGESIDCTVMFTDFAGFSTITQHLVAGEVVEALNTYFDSMIPIIKKYGGFPDKYIGDAIVAIFGAPVHLSDHAERAVLASIEMQNKMREINETRRREKKPYFEMRIGLNSGNVIAGAIGCDMKLEYTAIGETTNLANRMESACQIGHVMMAAGTYMKTKNIFFPGVHIPITPEPVHVKGYNDPVSGYRIYVDNMSVSKNMEAKSFHSFYVYEKKDYQIKQSPEEIQGSGFTSVAKCR